MTKCISQYYLLLDRKIDLNFKFERCAVDTVVSIQGMDEEEKNEFGYLRLSIEYELKEYESVSTGAIFSRPRYLSLLGIISYLIDEPFDVFGSHVSSGVSPDGIEELNLEQESRLLIDDVDLTEFLTELISKLESAQNHEKSLIFSLLDRWRKGRYMEKESDESFLYEDEATLSYFHVLELLGDLYSKPLIQESKKLIEKFSNTFNSDILSLSGQALENENISKSKLLLSVLNKDISVGAKISFFLKKFDLYGNQTAFWIKNLIEARNSVAHGRRVHYDKAIFPVQPFFPLISNTLYPLEFLRILAAKTISSHIGISIFDKKWAEIEDSLILDNFRTRGFIRKERFQAITDLAEDERTIVFGGLNYCVLSNKIKITNCINFYKFYLSTEKENVDFLCSNIDALVLLYEVTDNQELEDELKTSIVNIHRMGCNPHSRFRDMRYFLEFHNFESPKLEALIISKEIR